MNPRVISYLSFTFLTLLWLGFGAVLIINPEMVHTAWQAFRSWHLVGQASATILALPIILSLCVWHAAWPIWLKVVLVAGLFWASVYTFFPKRPVQPTGTPAQL